MATNTLDYCSEKLAGAIEELAIDPRKLPIRLMAAYNVMHTLSEHDFPDTEMRELFLSIRDGWTRNAATGNRGTVDDALNSMDTDTAQEIIRKIYHLNRIVEQRQRMRDGGEV